MSAPKMSLPEAVAWLAEDPSRCLEYFKPARGRHDDICAECPTAAALTALTGLACNVFYESATVPSTGERACLPESLRRAVALYTRSTLKLHKRAAHAFGAA